MTRIEQIVYNIILDYYDNHGVQPTLREIVEANSDISSLSTVHKAIEGLVEQGYLIRLGVSRVKNYELVATDKIAKRRALIKLKHFEEIVAQEPEFSNDFRQRLKLIAATERGRLG